MNHSLFQLNSLKRRGGSVFLLASPVLFSLVAPAPVQAQPKAAPVLMGVVDEEKLAQSRSDFPLLIPKVLPQVVAKRHLTLVVTRQGLRWGQSKVPSVDVTNDVLVLLNSLPASPGALTGNQYAAAKRIMSALGSLKSVTRLGNFSQEDYQTRLANAYVVYEANLPQVPEGDLKTQLATAMQEFLDSRATWDVCLQSLDLKWKTIDVDIEREKLKTPEALQWRIDLSRDTRRQKAQDEAYAPLYAAWAKAGEEVDAARKLLPASPTP